MDFLNNHIEVMGLSEEENKKVKNDIINKMKKKFEKNYITEIKQKKFRNKTTGEIKTQLSIFELKDFEEVK